MFVPLCWFLAKEGLPDLPLAGGYGAYYTDYGFKEWLRAHSAYLQESQRLHILESPWMGISLDESTDRIHGKHLIIYATFLKNTTVVTEFLTLITVDRCDAASLTSAVVQYLTAIGVDLRKISGISTDGASVMTGKNNGVVVRLRMRIPHLASIHCIAHREALAARDAADAMPELCMVDDAVRAFAEHIGCSSVHYQKFQNLQQIFCQTNLQAQGIHAVRWLSRGEAVNRLLEVLPAAVVELNHLNQRFQQHQAHIVQQTRLRLEIRYSLRDLAGHFGAGEKMQLLEFIKNHQSLEKREMKAEGIDTDGTPVSFVYTMHEQPLPDHETDADVTACIEMSMRFVKAVDGELE
ncbi:unnamed protein product [Closterium sp. NIES-53]